MKTKTINIIAILLINLLGSSISAHAFDWPWEKSGDSKEVRKEDLIKQIQDLKNENAKYKNYEIEFKNDYESRLQSEKRKLDELHNALIEFRVRLETANEVLKLKEGEVEAEKQKANDKAKVASELQIQFLTSSESLRLKEKEIQAQSDRQSELEAELKNIYTKIPGPILDKYGVKADPRPNIFGRIKIALSCLIFSIFLFIILLAMSHSHRKGDFILWLNQKVWGKRLVSTISQYGIAFFCIYEIAANIPTVNMLVDKVLNWITRGV
jgi:hypothetical protein